MKRLLFIFLLFPASAFARTGIDTTGFDGIYNVGDVIGGIRVASVIHLSHSNLPGLQPGRTAANGGTSQTEWDVYVLDSNMTISAGTGAVMEFRRNNVGSFAPKLIIIDLQDHILTVNQDTGTGGQVIRMTNGGGGPSTIGGVTDSVIIKNGTIIHNLNDRFHGEDATIQFQDINWIDFINLDIKINYAYSLDNTRYSVGGVACYSSDAAASNSVYGNYQIYFDDVNVWNYSTAFYRRDRVMASGFQLNGVHRKDSMNTLFGIVTDTGWYHYTIKNSVIHITPHFGWFINGSLDFHDNVCSTAARNDYYEYYEGGSNPTMTKEASVSYPFPDASFPADGQWPQLDSGIAYGTVGLNGWNSMWSSDNSYAFALSDGKEVSAGAGPGTKIYNNTAVHIYTHGAYHGVGNRGFTIEHPYGTASEPVLIHDNTITVAQGRTGFFSTGSVWGARIRWGGQYMQFYNNTITMIVDSREIDGTAEGSIPSSVGSTVYGFRWTAMSEVGSGSASHISVYNNNITTLYNNDTILGASGVHVNDFGYTYDNWQSAVPDNNEIYGNRLQVVNTGIRAGGLNTDGPVHNTTFYNDTIVRGSPYDTANWKSIRMGFGDLKADSNVVYLDLVYQGGADESQISVAKDGEDYWRWARTGKVLVVGTGTPPNVGVPNSNVTISNNYSQTVASAASTGADAVLIDTLYYSRRGAGSFVDSLLYNPFTFNATKGTDTSPDSVVTINSSRNSVILVLGSTAGSVDTTGWQGAVAAGSAPVAAFSGTPLIGTVTFSVTFTDQSANSPTSWAWTFGDGGSSTLQNPSHNYTTAGTYDVQLIATNANGADTLQKVGYITANNPAPTSSGNRVKVLQ